MEAIQDGRPPSHCLLLHHPSSPCLNFPAFTNEEADPHRKAAVGLSVPACSPGPSLLPGFAPPDQAKDSGTCVCVWGGVVVEGVTWGTGVKSRATETGRATTAAACKPLAQQPPLQTNNKGPSMARPQGAGDSAPLSSWQRSPITPRFPQGLLPAAASFPAASGRDEVSLSTLERRGVCARLCVFPFRFHCGSSFLKLRKGRVPTAWLGLNPSAVSPASPPQFVGPHPLPHLLLCSRQRASRTDTPRGVGDMVGSGGYIPRVGSRLWGSGWGNQFAAPSLSFSHL